MISVGRPWVLAGNPAMWVQVSSKVLAGLSPDLVGSNPGTLVQVPR